MNPKSFRWTVRGIHLVLSAVLGAFLYSPWSANPIFDGLVRFGAFPLLGVTGIALWQQARILRMFGERRPVHRATAAEGKL